MKHNSKLRNILLVLLSILIPIIVILGSGKAVIFNRPYQELLILHTEAPFHNYDELNNLVMDFLEYKTDSIDSPMFTADEKSHLSDVRLLIKRLNSLFIYSVLTFIISMIISLRYFKDLIRKSFFYGGILTVSILVLVSLVSAINFEFAFILFHKIFFPQGNYIFTTNLTKLYKETFFFYEALAIAGIAFIVSLVLILQKYLSYDD